jgi:hypothetical protein
MTREEVAPVDEPFYRKPGESAADWHARLAGMDPVCLSCHLRQRRKVWLEMADDALRKERRANRARRPARPRGPTEANDP